MTPNPEIPRGAWFRDRAGLWAGWAILLIAFARLHNWVLSSDPAYYIRLARGLLREDAPVPT